MRYRIRLKKTGIAKNIEASTELEARVKFCEGRGFNYRVYAPMLEVEPKGRTPTRNIASNSLTATR